jgi:hypothetical protein
MTWNVFMLLSFQNGLENVMRMSKYLGTPCDETFANIVLNTSSFENVKEKNRNTGPVKIYRKGKIKRINVYSMQDTFLIE